MLAGPQALEVEVVRKTAGEMQPKEKERLGAEPAQSSPEAFTGRQGKTQASSQPAGMMRTLG